MDSQKFKENVSKLRKKRGTIKRKITMAINGMEDDSSPANVISCRNSVSQYLVQISNYDEGISELYDALNDEPEGGEEISDEYGTELDTQTEYTMQIGKFLASLTIAQETKVNSSENSDCKLKLPELKLDCFTGEGSNNLEFHSFITKFNNMVGLRTTLSNSTKLTYLKNYVKGYAYKLISHLQISDVNYQIAIEVLEKEFLNKEALIDELFKTLIELKPDFDKDLMKTKVFLNDVKCILSDLCTYDCDLLCSDSSKSFISHMVFGKLPFNFRQEMIRRTNCNYPNIDMIFDNYSDVVKTLNLRFKGNYVPKNDPVQNKSVKTSVDKYAYSTPPVQQHASTAENVRHNYPEYKIRNCKFCNATNHSMFNCKKFPGHESRLERCKELNLCLNCSSLRHHKSACKPLDFSCTICGTKNHISALCPKYINKSAVNWCINSSASGNSNILPTVLVTVGQGKNKTKLRCLLDTGSQRSYLSSKVVGRVRGNSSNKVELLINTFLEKSYRSFSEVSMCFNVEGERPFNLPFLVDDKFDLSFSINGLKEAHYNIGRQYNLAEKLLDDCIIVEGLLGADAIQYLSVFEKVECVGGAAFKLSNGIIPFGNVDNFLYNKQLNKKYSSNMKKNVDENSVQSSVVNFVLEPTKSYFDPIDSVANDSMIDGKIENLFNVESLGIAEDGCDYDEVKINEFTSNISFEDGSYQVKLPWNDNLDEVKPNFEVCKKVVDRVVEKLHVNKLYDRYNDVLEQQLKDDIIEQIDLVETDVNSHVWIPHRAVIREDEKVTTKLRIVLNCSLKIGKSPSLNEAAYPGINLLNDLLQLLIKVRSNDYMVMSDIKSAFLMIKLKDINDRNRFSILWRDRDGKLKAFRYKCVVFGFISSPFILNHVVKEHIAKYEKDECFHILNSNLYVDNLFFTGNDYASLCNLYQQSFARMQEGGFTLRSWATNCSELKDKFIDDENLSMHGSVDEKLLGYEYSTVSDQIKIAYDVEPTGKLITKRYVLSYISKYFDPLGLTLPVTVQGKILMKQIWSMNIEWDEEIPDELKSKWYKIESDFVKLHELEFKRKAYEGRTSLIIFTDASEQCYGFSCYARYSEGDEVKTNSLFANSKNAPQKKKSLPTLELLGVFLAFKCLPTILKAVNDVITGDVTICVDAQVVLSWLLTEKVKAKNVFAKNRIKDISVAKKLIYDQSKLNVVYKYVPTNENPADMLTRGLSVNDFQTKFELWTHGPEFIQTNKIVWPDKDLDCLSAENKILNINVCIESSDSIFPITKYSTHDRVLKITSLVFKFCYQLKRSKKSDLECYNMSKLYWLKQEQATFFKEECGYLKNKTETSIPSRVGNLNLYLDDDGLLRSRTRLENCSYFCTEVKNPILLPRHSYLTELIIWYYHKKCLHLGTSTTLNYVRREGFWIPHARAVVKKVISKCITCRKINCNHFKYPNPTNLPADRVNLVKPYKHVGVDYTGHLFVKLNGTVVKMYILVFTCLNIRAVHLELLPSMSCQHFLQAFLRFCNLYTIPDTIYSDNASQFCQAMKLLTLNNVDNEFEEFLTKHDIKHVKIPLYAAWVGSTWERLIKVIKSCFYKTVGRKKLDYFKLITILSDITNSINSRPLTYRDTEDNQFEVITPNCFIKFETGRRFLPRGCPDRTN